MIYAIRMREAEPDEMPEAEVVKIEDEGGSITVVARGYLRADFAATPEPGQDVATSVIFHGMGIES